jgi:hypothetical protein
MLCKLSSYDLLNELACTDIDPAGEGAVCAPAGQPARLDTVLAENDFKIKALTFELAYYKRVRFGKASEAIVREQRMLFNETVDMDLAAIDEELRSPATTKPPRSMPAVSRCHGKRHASNNATSRHRARAVNAAPRW